MYLAEDFCWRWIGYSYLALLLLCLLGVLWWLQRPEDLSLLSDTQKQARIQQMYQDYQQSFPKAPAITVSQLLAKNSENYVLVDVRSPEEQEVSMIAGAISQQQFEQNQEQYRDKTIVLYCTIGYRSGLYTEKLRKANFQAFNLIGSILAWTHHQQQLQNNQGEETRKVHVYGPQWNLVAKGYQGTY